MRLQYNGATEVRIVGGQASGWAGFSRLERKEAPEYSEHKVGEKSERRHQDVKLLIGSSYG